VATAAATIPATIDDVDAAWLTGRLRAADALEGTTSVADVDVEPIGVGIGVMSLLYRLTLGYQHADAGPASLVVKLPSLHGPTREVARGYRFYGREAAFYTHLGGQTRLPSPSCYYAAHDATTDDFVLLMEDLSGLRVCDQLGGCSLDDALLIATTLARHHAEWWNNPRLLDYPFIESPADPPYPQYNARSVTDAWTACLEHVGDLVPDHLHHVGERWPEIGPRIMEMTRDQPWTLTHGDVRLDNVFFHDDADGSLSVVDWQICYRSAAATDLAYFMSQSLAVADRRAHEADIVGSYYEALVAGGVEGYSLDDLWRDYRRGILFCFCYPVSTAGQLDLVNERAVALVRCMTERSVAAIDDLDATELIPV